jgi:hypothetical protein
MGNNKIEFKLVPLFQVFQREKQAYRIRAARNSNHDSRAIKGQPQPPPFRQ